jgi:hypothetical protein
MCVERKKVYRSWKERRNVVFTERYINRGYQIGDTEE